MPVLEEIQEEVEAIEDRVLSKPMTGADIERLYMLRRDLLRLRNAADPLVEVCRRLTGRTCRRSRPAMHNLFRDVTDHIRTVQEKIDNLREVLAFAFEASLLVGQSQETAIAKKLASWAAILAVPTAVAGIYGMNFDDMPELKSAVRLSGRARLHLASSARCSTGGSARTTGCAGAGSGE